MDKVWAMLSVCAAAHLCFAAQPRVVWVGGVGAGQAGSAWLLAAGERLLLHLQSCSFRCIQCPGQWWEQDLLAFIRTSLAQTIYLHNRGKVSDAGDRWTDYNRYSVGSTTHKQELLDDVKVKGSLGFSDHKTVKFRILRVLNKINNRITNLDLKRADLDLQKAEQALKKMRIDEHEAPDLTLNTKRKYTEAESRDKLGEK